LVGLKKRLKMQKINNYFEKHPKETEVHMTSDGFLFKRKDQADAHAASFKAKEEQKVKTFFKSDLTEAEPVSEADIVSEAPVSEESIEVEANDEAEETELKKIKKPKNK